MDTVGSFLSAVTPKYDDDGVDRLNYYYTVVVMGILSVLLAAKQYVGEPLQCFVPAEFTKTWEQYTENHCFVENTYWVPYQDGIPGDLHERTRLEITYYQWIPFVLALQAMMFYVPHLIWTMLSPQSGINVREIINMATDGNNMSADSRSANVKTIASHLYAASTFQKRIGRSMNPFMWILGCGKPKGVYITLLYIVVKFLFIINVIGQMFILNSFIGSKYPFWGAQILGDVGTGASWQKSGHFPRTTICDFDVKWLGNVHRHSVECVLMINMFSEKIYIFLWFWFLIVSVMTIINTIWWIIQTAATSRRVNFVKKYYKASRKMAANVDTIRLTLEDRQFVEAFVRSKLRPDGVLILRLVASNAGDALATEVVHDLYQRFIAERKTESLSVSTTFSE